VWSKQHRSDPIALVVTISSYAQLQTLTSCRSTSRHGWGCTPDPAGAVNYLSAAASNAATVENLALHAGLKKGGAAKGELVLAIFELANCFRHGWGIPKDPVAAKQVRLLLISFPRFLLSSVPVTDNDGWAVL